MNGYSNFNVSKSAIHKWVKQFKNNSSLIFNDSSISQNNKKKSTEVHIAKYCRDHSSTSTIGIVPANFDVLRLLLRQFNSNTYLTLILCGLNVRWFKNMTLFNCRINKLVQPVGSAPLKGAKSGVFKARIQ